MYHYPYRRLRRRRRCRCCNHPFPRGDSRFRKKGNKQAELTKILFDAQLGIIGIDSESKKVILLKDAPYLEGKGFYPADITK